MSPHDVPGAVLQQEIILICGKLIETQPWLFQGILVLRYQPSIPLCKYGNSPYAMMCLSILLCNAGPLYPTVMLVLYIPLCNDGPLYPTVQ